MQERLDAFEWQLERIHHDLTEIRRDVMYMREYLGRLDERVPAKPKTAVTVTLSSAIATAIAILLDMFRSGHIR